MPAQGHERHRGAQEAASGRREERGTLCLVLNALLGNWLTRGDIRSHCCGIFGVLDLQFPVTSIREMKILKFLKHPNIVALKEIVSSSGRTTA